MGHQEKVLHWEGGQSLQQAPWESVHGTKAAWAQGVSEQLI